VALSRDTNPDVLVGAPEANVGRVDVGGVRLHVETRGEGDPILIIGAADEDAEIYRGIAERLAGTNTVVTYDRRGTGRSDRNGWPTDSARHAGDAAALIKELGLVRPTVLGTSAGGIVALRLALRHPERLGAVVCFEPGVFHVAEGGDEFRDAVERAVSDHLSTHPGDWEGASDVLGRVAASSIDDMTSLFSPPAGKDWYAHRSAAEAEALIKGDLPLTGERFDLGAVAGCPLPLAFSYGTSSLPMFRQIAENLAATRGELPLALPGVGHSIFYHPDEAVTYLRHVMATRASRPNST